MGDAGPKHRAYAFDYHIEGLSVVLSFTDYLSGLGPLEWVGVVGFICYISAFGAVQFGKLDGNSAGYSLANILAASLVAISLFAEFNLASALIQTSWIIAGIVGLVLRARHSWAVTRAAFRATLNTEVAS